MIYTRKSKNFSWLYKLTMLPLMLLVFAFAFSFGNTDLLNKSADAASVTVTLNANNGVLNIPGKSYNYQNLTLLHISTDSQLASFRNEVNNGKDFSSYAVVLDNNVNFSGAPIGTSSKPFNGIFDGQGYQITVTGLSMTGSYDGLFGYVASSTSRSAGLYNLKVHYNNISFSGTSTFGGLVGYIGSSSSYRAQIQNCGVSSASTIMVPTCTDMGGIVGDARNTDIRYTYNAGTISKGNSSNMQDSNSHVGGLVGRITNVVISNCYNSGAVSGYNKGLSKVITIGGIVGYEGSSSTNGNLIEYTFNTGSIFGHQNYLTGYLYTELGGIIGHIGTNSCISINNCFNTGTMSANKKGNTDADRYFGGIAGGNTSGKVPTINKSYYIKQSNFSEKGVSAMGAAGSNSDSSTNAIQTSASNLQSQSFLSNSGNWYGGAYDFTNTWYMNSTTPNLKVFTNSFYRYEKTLKTIRPTYLEFTPEQNAEFTLVNQYSRAGYTFVGFTDENGYLNSNSGVITDEELSDIFVVTGVNKNLWLDGESFSSSENKQLYVVWRANLYPLMMNFMKDGSSTFCTTSKLVYYQTNYTFIAKDIIKEYGLDIYDALEGYKTSTPIIQGFMDPDLNQSTIMKTITINYVKNSFELRVNYILLDENGEVDQEANASLATKSASVIVEYGKIGSIKSPDIVGYTIQDSSLSTVEEYMHKSNSKLIKTQTETETDFIEEGGITVDVYYTLNKYKLNINYINSSGKNLAGVSYSNHSSEVYYSRNYSVDSPVFEGKYYLVDESQSNINGVMGASDVTINVVYAPYFYTLKIDYIYKDGTKASQTVVKEYEYNYTFTEVSPTIFGYSADNETITGTVGTEDITRTVTYSPKAYKYNIYYNYSNGETARETISSRQYYGTSFTIDEYVIFGYEASISGDINLKMINTSEWWKGDNNDVVNDSTSSCSLDVYVVYSPKVYDVVVSYQDEEGNTLSEDSTTKVNYDDEYTIEIKGITGYTPTVEVVTGTVNQNDENWTENKIEYTVVYTINIYTLTINYVYTNGQLASESLVKEYEYNYTYSEASPEIFGYTADFETVTGTIGIEDVTKTVTFSPKEYEIVVSYQDEEGNTLSEDSITKVNYDLEYSLEIKEITGYTSTVDSVVGTVNQNDVNWTENKIEYTVVYSINIYTLTVNYVYLDGETASEILIKQFEYNSTYLEASPEIFGYTADIETVTGTFGAEDVTITVTYSPKEYDVVAKYQDENGNTLSEDVTTKVNYDADYSIEIKEITGYTSTIDSVVGIVNQNDVNWTENKIEYTVIYTINVYNFIINYVHLNGETASGTLITQYEYNYEYSEASPEIFGYTADIEIVTGTIGTEDVTITVTYSPKEYDVVAKYQDEEGNTLSEDVTTKVNYDADYSIEIKEITGYTATIEEVTGLVNQNDQNWAEDKIEYIVVYTINFYSLTIRYEDEDGNEVGMIYQMSYEYNSTYNVESLVVDGYTVVSGQEVVTGTMGAEDVSVTVNYTTNEYTLTYYVNGLIYNEENFTIKSEDILLEEIVLDGYTFNGWYTSEELVNSIDRVSQGTYGDLNVYAAQIADEHYVRFYVSIGEGNYELQEELTEIFTIESSDFELENIEKIGYAFSGWFTEESLTTSIDKVSQGTYVDIDVYGNFSIVTYTLSYKEVGYDETNLTLTEDVTELSHESLTLSYDIEDFVEGKLNLATLTRTGYIFNGWFTEQTCENTITEINEANIGSKVLYTYFSLNTYDLIVEFRIDSNDGNLIYTLPAQQVKYTNSYNISLQDIEIEGYSFAETSVEGVMDSEGKTVVVILTANTYDITINFVDEQNNTMFESVVEQGCKFGENYSFDYSDKVVEGYTANLIVEGTLDETAKVINVVYVPIVYQITYYIVDESGKTIYTQDDLTRSYTILDEVTTQTISKTGYTFYGWYSDEECESLQTIISSGTTGDVDLYGYFAINSYTLTIRYVDEEGIEIGTTYEGSYEYNSTYNVESLFVDGYTVVSGQEVVTGTMGAEDESITVTYTANDYTLTYYVNGIKYNEENFTIKSEDIILETLVLNGYTFDGWYADEDLTISIDKVSQGTYVDTNVYASKTAVKHYVRFYVSIEEGNYELQEDLTEEYTIESQDLILQNIDKTGYTFSGWFKEESLTTSVDKISQGTYVDINVYGKFSYRVYNVTYYVDGLVNDTLELKSFTLPDLTEEITLENLTKTGYTFSGWFTDVNMTTGNEITEISECKDYVLYSRFIVNAYKLIINYSYSNGKLPEYTDEIDIDYNQVYNEIVPTVYGYNSNITTISGTMDENGREVDVVYIPKTFNLIINYSYSDGNYFDSTSSSVITFDENYTEQIPEVYGYNAYENDEMITTISSVLTVEENVNVYIVYKPVKVQLTINYFYLNGEVAKEASVYQVDFAQTYNFAVEMIAGYTPDYDRVTGKVRTIDPIVAKVIFTSNVYKIYIINTENDEVKYVSVIYNSTVSLKNKFERKGYNFLGWSKTENGKVILKEGEEFVYNTPTNITIYTIWEKKNTTGTVVAIVLSSVAGAAGLGVGGFFAFKYKSDIASFFGKLFGKNNKKVIKNNKKRK